VVKAELEPGLYSLHPGPNTGSYGTFSPSLLWFSIHPLSFSLRTTVCQVYWTLENSRNRHGICSYIFQEKDRA
jgi:hypothetical protein